MISKQFQSIVSTLLLSVLLGFSDIARAASQNTLYFYSPEVSTSRNTVLKGTFDSYLVQKGKYQFQPVENQIVFEELLISGQADALLMSSSHFSQLSTSNPSLSSKYFPILQGVRNGRDTYLKLLISSSNEPVFNQGQVLASSSSPELTRDLLNKMFPKESKQNFDLLNILEVPKDIDALMAVGLGMANMALTTDDSLLTLSTLYKDQYDRLKIIGTSIPQKRIILILSKDSIEKARLSGEMIYPMPRSSLGRRAMKLIGLDSWQWIRPEGTDLGGLQ